MTSKILVAASLLAASVAPSTVWAAGAANCGSAASQTAGQGAGLGPSCEGQQPTTTSGAAGAGTGTTSSGPGGQGGASGGSGGSSK